MFFKLTRVATLFLAVLATGLLVALTLRDRAPSRQQGVPAVVRESSNELRLDIIRTPVAAPDFELQDPTGRKVRLEEFRGKVVFLNFWATWCPPCVEEMPAMEKLHRELQGNGLVILAVNFQEGPERVKDFLTQRDLTFTALLDRDGKVAERYQAWALPVSVLINKRGEIVAKAMGSRNWAGEDAMRFFRKLIAEET